MRILLVNPNTTASMTSAMAESVVGTLALGTELIVETAPYGPESIEGYYDEVFSVPPLLEVVAAHRYNVDGIVIGCFDDTGVDAVRCVTTVPTIGICQAAMQAATVLAGSFSVITTLGRSVPALEHLAVKYGYERHCRRVRACEVPVLELEDETGDARAKLTAELERALEEDGAEAIVLGCAGMSAMARKLSLRYGVPVIDGVGAALKVVEGLAALGLSTSKKQGYAPPRAKRYTGRFKRHAPV